MQRTLMGIVTMIVFSAVGLLLGTAIWGIIMPSLPIPEALRATYPLGGTSPMLDLRFMQMQISFYLDLNLGSLIGMFVGFYLYTRK